MTPIQLIKLLTALTQQHFHFTRRDLYWQAACFATCVGFAYFAEGALAAVGVGMIIIGLGTIMLLSFLAGTIQPKHSVPAGLTGKPTDDDDDDPPAPGSRSRRSLLAEREVGY